MTDPNFVILYVDSPIASATFYEGLFGAAPVELAPTFALFVLKSGLKLGLWSRHTVEPGALATGGGCELVITVDGLEAVEALHAEWVVRGLSILQAPTTLDFGRTFVAADPDGHRLRVYFPMESEVTA